MGSAVICERKREKTPASIGRKCINNHIPSPGPINMEQPRWLTGLYFTLLRLAALGSINSNPVFPLSQHRCLYLLCWHLHVCVFFLPGLNIQYPCCSLSASQWCHIPAVKAHTIAWLWDYTARNWSCVFIRGKEDGAADRQCGATKPPVDCGSATHVYKLNLGRGAFTAVKATNRLTAWNL